MFYDYSTTDMNSSVDDAEEETAGGAPLMPRPAPNTFRSPDASTSARAASPIRRQSHLFSLGSTEKGPQVLHA